MKIVFLMDNIKNYDLLYTYTHENVVGFENVSTEHYHGEDYCKSIVTDIFSILSKTEWTDYAYVGSISRIANESFKIISKDGCEYKTSFAINTYNGKAAHLEVTVVAPSSDTYDQKLEKLKIALKNRLLNDWEKCTWLIDDQAAILCKNAYELAFVVENDLRAFASKVLIHFLGIDWIKRFGLEKESESVNNLKDKFTQRVPEFDNINTDFLSMTLDTLVGVIFKGNVYNDTVFLNRQDYFKLQEMGNKEKIPGKNLSEYVKGRRTIDKRIWDDLFVPYIDDSDAFKTVTNAFIEDRNHIAHSKVLSLSSYNVIINDFNKMKTLILAAEAKFEREETSSELLQTWEAEQENDDYEREYYRERLAGETGMDILDESEIKTWFDEVMHDIYNGIYQRYHLDVCYEISQLTIPSEKGITFSISCPAVEDDSARIDITMECMLDDDLGSSSTCHITAISVKNEEECGVDISFHNGDGCEGEQGIMEATDSSEYDTSGLDDFIEELCEIIESLNPYPSKLDYLAYQDKGAVAYVADFPCEQCGKYGVSINENFLPIGRCCYCGYEHDLQECERCCSLVDADSMENGFCPSCAAYIDKQ